ncbi:MAG TPA: diguanylate cyclase [Candidatus Obscuribacter sp.]|nr:diguanylate cyclase response regulator [Candidatus Obscuribacter sp.]HMW92972.1 diguanylate cyclase [Candidatus Obscuribacter sp.]HMY03929.1 diguanylate cyclase [Candidatus Obscuribacter sp.]HMY55916.1 diguanylate cyclase [Candidatus Obscuribacter sp.]HNB17357.1 diguanylate cyclase [Candidatus Obscuribacter sp.]
MSDIKVLYVEDAKSSGGALRQALKDAHMNAVYLGGGFDALDELADSGADAVVACLDLVDLPGYQLSALIKSSSVACRLPVILFGVTGSKVDPLWIKASQADAYFTDKEVTDAKAVVAKLKELVEDSRKQGFDRQKSQALLACRSNFSSSKVVESANLLLDELVLSRSASALAARLGLSENRKDLLDSFFNGIFAFVEADLVGLVMAASATPWAAFHCDKVVSGSYKKLTERLSTELELKSELQIELRGELTEGTGKDMGSVQIVPVSYKGRALGALVVASKDRNAFSDQSLAFGEMLGQALPTAFELLLARETISDMQTREAYRASIDSLTGLYNLEFLVGFLQQQLLFSFRQRLPVAVVIVDIDAFSKVNQEHGFEFGDGALMTIANRLLNITRSSDLIARYGGDQFAVVLPNTDVAGARVLAEKVRSDVESLDFSNGSKGHRITVSVGCASFNMEDLNPETILRDAKLALRKAKDEGRNRISAG